MSQVKLSESLQDYLKTIYCLQKEAGGVSASALAENLGVSLPSVSGMMRKLAARKLVSYSPYAPISLTPAGEREALEVVRHHRLLESYLQKAFGFGLEALHSQAERLEHALSDELEEKIDDYLGHPAFDPHGSPIPDAGGQVSARALEPLASLREGETGVVRQVTCRNPEQLRHLEEIGLVPGAAVLVLSAARGSGVIRVQLASRGDEPVGEALAACVLVARNGGPS